MDFSDHFGRDCPMNRLYTRKRLIRACLRMCFHAAEGVFRDRSCSQYIRREMCVDTSQVSMAKCWDGPFSAGRISRIPG